MEERPVTQPRACLVLTTINDPVVLDGYLSNFRAYGHLDQVRTIVVPDLKTRREAFLTCERLRAAGLETACPGLDEQNQFLRRIGLRPDAILTNSDHRRNVGFLMALEAGCDFLISIDDDNYARPEEDLFAAHAVVTRGPAEQDIASDPSGFFNACELLDVTPPLPVYPRGFPYGARFASQPAQVTPGAAEVAINAGLWLGDPDVDAMTWLSMRPTAGGFRGRSVVLDPAAWAPVNTQNTALRAELIPTYYFIRMGYAVNGAAVDRYGDIFSGYFAQACAKHLGWAVRFGAPVADHRRNSHNYFRDAAAEWLAIQVIEDLAPWLRTARLSGSSPCETYASLAAALDDAAECFRGAVWTDSTRGFLHQMAHYMREWLAACRTILGLEAA